MNNSLVVYPISANPPTLGHADILRRATQRFKKVFWIAAVNPEKKYDFPKELQLEMMADYITHFEIENVEIAHFWGSLVRYAMEKDAGFILRGIRNTSDLQSEMELSIGYRGIDSSIETICFFADPSLVVINSSLVRQLAMVGEDISQYVLPSVAEKIKKRYESLKK